MLTDSTYFFLASLTPSRCTVDWSAKKENYVLTLTAYFLSPTNLHNFSTDDTIPKSFRNYNIPNLCNIVYFMTLHIISLGLAPE